MKRFLVLILLGFFVLGLPAWAGSLNAVGSVRGFVLQNNPAWSDGKVVISLKGADKFIKKYSGKGVKFEVPSDYRLTRITPKMILPLRAVKGGMELGRTTVYVLVEVYNDVLVAKQKIGRGELFSADNLEIKKKEISLYPDKYFRDIEGLQGKVSKSLIPEGAVLFSWMVKSKPLVKKGGSVSILVVTPQILLETQGRTLEDGQLDEVIKVRRDGAKDILRAVVVSSFEVEVRI